MDESLRNRHLYHILPCSPWPILISFSAFFLVSGAAFYMHEVVYGGYLSLLGVICLSYCASLWLGDVIDESTSSGYHTKAVRIGLKLGFLLFIVSEIMLFFGFFWAFFHGALCPSIEVGSIFPPEGLFTIPVFDFPLYNTFILIASGLFVTWSHRSLSLGLFKEALDSSVFTVFLGFVFVILQMFEYYEAPFNFFDSVYASSFFMLTGLHGCHVLAGATFLFICLVRLIKRHFLQTHYLGFIFAIWYWHFVDVVWIFLFMSVYCWGSW